MITQLVAGDARSRIESSTTGNRPGASLASNQVRERHFHGRAFDRRFRIGKVGDNRLVHPRIRCKANLPGHGLLDCSEHRVEHVGLDDRERPNGRKRGEALDPADRSGEVRHRSGGANSQKVERDISDAGYHPPVTTGVGDPQFTVVGTGCVHHEAVAGQHRVTD